VAGIYGAKRLSNLVNKLSLNEWVGFITAASLITGYYFSPLPLPGARNVWAPANLFNRPDPSVPIIRSVIGDNASVSAQANIGAHFSQRKEIYLYPNKVDEVDSIILKMDSPTKKTGNNSTYQIQGHTYLVNTLDVILQMGRKEYLASIKSLLGSKEYGILLWNDPWLILSKGKTNQNPQQIKKIEQKINHLWKEWKIDLNDPK
jgi:hypothetical protein